MTIFLQDMNQTAITVRADFRPVEGGVMAVDVDHPHLYAIAATKNEAISQLLPLVMAAYRAKAESVTIVEVPKAVEGPTAAETKPSMTNDDLLFLADRCKPPQSWYDSDEDENLF